MKKCSSIKEMRQAMRLNQQRFATSLGVKQSTIALWESGDRTPTMENADKIKKLALKNDISIEFSDMHATRTRDAASIRVGQEIHTLRIMAAITQVELEALLHGLGYININELEKGKVKIDKPIEYIIKITLLDKFAQKFGVAIKQAVGLEVKDEGQKK